MGKAQARLDGTTEKIYEEAPSMERATVPRHTGVSDREVLENEPDRIAQYIPDRFKKIIINAYTARLGIEAMLSAEEDLRNLLGEYRTGVKWEGFVDYLVETYAPGNEEKAELVKKIEGRWIASPTMLNPYTNEPVTKTELKRIHEGRYWGATWFR